MSLRSNIVYAVLIMLTSCTTAKLPVQPAFANQSVKMPVKGLNGWMINQKLSFGNYQTYAIKRGWDFKNAIQFTKFSIRPEEAILKVFDIDTEKKNLQQKNKFQYTIQGDSAAAEVYATEKFSEKQLVYKSNNPYIGGASKTKKYEYAFTAAIIPLTENNAAPWSLVLINAYDITKEPTRGLFDKPYVEEEGYATNGTESMAISPMHVDTVAAADGNKTKIFGGKLLGGYEISIDNKPIAIIDILDNSISMSNDIKSSQKIIVSSIASAILLKRIQDVEKDKDDL